MTSRRLRSREPFLPCGLVFLLALAQFLIVLPDMPAQELDWPVGTLQPVSSPIGTSMGVSIELEQRESPEVSVNSSLVFRAENRMPFLAENESFLVERQSHGLYRLLRTQGELRVDLLYWDAVADRVVDPRAILPLIADSSEPPEFGAIVQGRYRSVSSWARSLPVRGQEFSLVVPETAEKWSLPARIVVIAGGTVAVDRYLALLDWLTPDTEGPSGYRQIGSIPVRSRSSQIEVIWFDYAGSRYSRIIDLEPVDG